MWIGSIRGGRAASSEETSPSPSTARGGSSAPPARVPAPRWRKPRAASVEDSRTSVTMEALEEGDEEEETGSIDRRHAARMQRAATVEDWRGTRAQGAAKATGGNGATGVCSYVCK